MMKKLKLDNSVYGKISKYDKTFYDYKFFNVTYRQFAKRMNHLKNHQLLDICILNIYIQKIIYGYNLCIFYHYNFFF